MKVIQKPIVFIDIIEVGETYTNKLLTIKAKDCSLEKAKQYAKDIGYQVIDELCNIVPKTCEVNITVAVESE